MRNPICFTLLISSPSDVYEERNLIEETCKEWNSSVGIEKNVIIEVKRWENDLRINSNKNPQSLINSQLVASTDLLVALFGKRFGSPTETHESGTIEEIDYFLTNGKQCIIYFMNHQYSIDEIDTNQVQKIKEFKKKLDALKAYKVHNDLYTLRADFFKDITYNVNLLLSSQKNEFNKEDIKSSNSTENKGVTSDAIEKTNWYEQSISELINRYLEENNQPFAIYKRGITFMENCNLWKSLTGVNYKPLVNIAKQARENAFNKKYGNYDYSKDLRSKYPNWHNTISEIIKKENKVENISVIGVASNFGAELIEIFNKDYFKNVELSVLDLSSNAIELGKKQHPHIVFHKGDMEESPIANSTHDIYINLRSIHSSGVDFRLTLADCHRILKNGGLAIISVSNGYLSPKKPGSEELFEINGLYDNRTEIFSKHRPYELARKIVSKLMDYGFQVSTMVTGETEIYIAAIK